MARTRCNYYRYVALVEDKEIYFSTYDEGAEKLNVTKWMVYANLNDKSTSLQRNGIFLYKIEDYQELVPVRQQRIDKGYSQVRKRKVCMLDPFTCEVLDIFDSLREAADDLGVKFSTNIGKCCRGKVKIAYGYKWEYAS